MRGWVVGLGALAWGCGTANVGPAPTPAAGFGLLGGQRVLLLPVHYAPSVAGRPVGGAASASEATRRADAEIAFALAERGGTTIWIGPDSIAAATARQPGIGVQVYALSADPLRRARIGRADRIGDPLHGEIRRLAALHDARYVVFPVELVYDADREGRGRVGLWTVLLDARTGFILWAQTLYAEPGPPDAAAAFAAVAAALARRLVP
jgi:hypothetical protein